MSRPSRSSLLGIAGLVLIPVLTACGAGNDAVTNLPYAPADGVQTVAADGSVKVVNALVVAPEKTPGDAVLVMGLVDLKGKGDELSAARVGDSGTVELGGETRIPPRGALLVGGGGAQTTAVIRKFEGQPGSTVPVELRLADAGVVKVNTVVYAQQGPYATVTPAAPTLGAGATGGPQPTLSVSPEDAEPAEGREGDEEPSPGADG
ncbi:MAG: hypothetical protein M3P48_05085 [Actinomycetota bacterium]|nr:hypothetical protein [Actinomycetota bacterium]